MRPEFSHIFSSQHWLKLQDPDKTSQARQALVKSASQFVGYPDALRIRHNLINPRYVMRLDDLHCLLVLDDLSCLMAKYPTDKSADTVGNTVYVLHPCPMRLKPKHPHSQFELSRQTSIHTPRSTWIIKTRNAINGLSFGTDVTDATHPYFAEIINEARTWLATNGWASCLLDYTRWNGETLYTWQLPKLSANQQRRAISTLHTLGEALATALGVPFPDEAQVQWAKNIQGRPGKPSVIIFGYNPKHKAWQDAMHAAIDLNPLPPEAFTHHLDGRNPKGAKTPLLGHLPYIWESAHERIELESHLQTILSTIIKGISK